MGLDLISNLPVIHLKSLLVVLEHLLSVYYCSTVQLLFNVGRPPSELGSSENSKGV